MAASSGSFYRDESRGGYYRNAEGITLHRFIWEDYYKQTIPEGYVIHHINYDKDNNEIDNLQCMTRSEHTSLHHKGKVLSEETRNKIEPTMFKEGSIPWNKGKEHSNNTKQKISDTKIGCKAWNKTQLTTEMINDIENNIRVNDFTEKHNLSRDVFYRNKRQLKEGLV